MKKFLTILFLTLISVIGFTQMKTHQNWELENEGEWGSFHWAVNRTINPDTHGGYYYYVYFYSNSYFNTKLMDGVNYDRASTFITNINVYMNEYSKNTNGKLVWYNKIMIPIRGVVCDWVFDESYYTAYFYSYSSYCKFRLTYAGASAYDYSLY